MNVLGFPDLYGVPLGVAQGGTTYADLVRSIAPSIWLRLKETSGTTAVNSGSLAGMDATWTPGSGGAVGQTGLLGSNEAYLFDAAGSIITFPNNAALDQPIFTYGMLVYPNSAGENNVARIWNFGNGTHRCEINVNRQITATIGASTTNAISTTSINTLNFNAWQWVFVTYDNTGDRKLRIYIGRSGALTEASYATQIAAAGTMGGLPGVLNVGNRSLVDTTWDGRIDEFWNKNEIVNSGVLQNLVTASAA